MIFFFALYKIYGQPNYKAIGELIDNVNTSRIEDSIIPLLLKYKDNYSIDDIKDIEYVCSKLNGLISRDIVKTVKSTFNKELWICKCCENKVSIKEYYCKCGNGKNGLNPSLTESIGEAIELLNDIVRAIN